MEKMCAKNSKNTKNMVCFFSPKEIKIEKCASGGPRSHRKEGAQNRPLLCLPFFFFFCAPSFFFFSFESAFLRALFPPSFFFFYNNFCLKTVFFRNFSRVFARALFRPPFFFFWKRPLFSFFLWRALYFSPSFRPPFFFFSALLSMGPNLY